MNPSSTMPYRRFGRSGHQSSVAIFGAAALWEATPAQAETALQQILEAGVNHIDVAPSYGRAEELLGPLLPPVRERFFLGCKTMERTRQGAWDELQRSLERLRVERFDLYQLHAVTSMSDLEAACARGGALEALLQAREQGLTRWLGITGHGVQAPAVFQEALRRFDFDSVLFPLNFVQYALPQYRQDCQTLLRMCQERDVGVMVIKAITRAPWGERPHTHQTWYEPFETLPEIQRAVNFALSQPGVSGLCTVGDLDLLPLELQACQAFTPLSPDEQAALIASAADYQPLFA